MCAAHEHPSDTAMPGKADISLHVEDMTCGHCASVIKSAIEKTIPGAAVHADPVTRTVKVDGTTDAAQIAEIIAAAGYTPETQA